MLQSLDYSVQFPTTGRCFQNRIEFAPGLTAITGRNEAGKTLNLEMIGYCLFGKAALRGLASDYKNLTATLHLTIRGKDVLIERARKETMTVDGVVEAIGAEAINRAIPQLLGFGLDVFNIACAAQQGDLDALTKMRPTDRRQMVDRLVGLDLLESIEKECRAEAKTQKVVAETLLLNLIQPEEPVQPEGYRPSAELEALIHEINEHERERLRLSQIQEPIPPSAPEAPAVTDVGLLEAHQEERQRVLQAQALLQGKLAAMPEPSVSREVLEQALAFQVYSQECARRGPQPEYALEQLQDWQRDYDLINRANAGETVCCPKCQHSFLAGDPDIDLDAVGAMTHPPLTERELTAQFRRHELWSEPLSPVESVVLPDLNKEIQAHANAADRAAVLDQLRNLELPADRSGDLTAARQYQHQLAVYSERADRYDTELVAFRDARARLAGMADRTEELATSHGLLAAARTFEGQLDRYAHDLAHYQSERSRADEALQRGDGFAVGARSLAAARLAVKGQLAPELSKAASTLLYAMTNGERRYIDVDEEFNVTVDGQPLQTLSGSGKSVVNLALRLGLGQVLTARVLPIFLGDELDADMDSGRSSATHSTMQSLRQYLSQIILVTHKDIEADNIVSLDTVSA